MRGAVQRCATATLFLGLHLELGATFTQPLPVARNTFVVVHRGELDVGGKQVLPCRVAVLASTQGSDGVRLQAGKLGGQATWASEVGKCGARTILLAGPPLKEPVAGHLPFAMNTPQEIFQAVEDFQQWSFGTDSWVFPSEPS